MSINLTFKKPVLEEAYSVRCLDDTFTCYLGGSLLSEAAASLGHHEGQATWKVAPHMKTVEWKKLLSC